MNGTTLTELGWDAREEHVPVPREHKDRPDTEMLICADERVSIFEEGQKWVKSDYTVEVNR